MYACSGPYWENIAHEPFVRTTCELSPYCQVGWTFSKDAPRSWLVIIIAFTFLHLKYNIHVTVENIYMIYKQLKWIYLFVNKSSCRFWTSSVEVPVWYTNNLCKGKGNGESYMEHWREWQFSWSGSKFCDLGSIKSRVRTRASYWWNDYYNKCNWWRRELRNMHILCSCQR